MAFRSMLLSRSYPLKRERKTALRIDPFCITSKAPELHGGHRMRRIASFLVEVATLAGIVVSIVPTSAQADKEAAPFAVPVLVMHDEDDQCALQNYPVCAP